MELLRTLIPIKTSRVLHREAQDCSRAKWLAERAFARLKGRLCSDFRKNQPVLAQIVVHVMQPFASVTSEVDVRASGI